MPPATGLSDATLGDRGPQTADCGGIAAPLAAAPKAV
jgi:hypothetical protein